MQPMYATLLRDGQPLASRLVVHYERAGDQEVVTQSEGPHYVYDGILPFRLPGGLEVQQNDYFSDEVGIDYVSQTNKVYQVINEPDPYPDGHYEFKMIKVRLPA